MKSAPLHVWMLVGWLVAAATAAGQAYNTPVRVSWVGDVSTTAAVTWDRTEAGRGTVQYGLTTNYTDTSRDGGGTHLHVVHLTDLTPGTRYYFRASSSDGYEQEGTFRTAPLTGDSLSFVFHGDLQGGINEPGAIGVASQIVQEDPEFILSLGDMAEEAFSGSGFDTWEVFFRILSNELARAVYMPIMGNHDAAPGSDYARGLFHRLFTLPEPSLGNGIYAYTVGNARFIVLNTEEAASEQSEWLSRELQAAVNNPDIIWIFALCHRPPYSWGERLGSDEFKDEWAPILSQYETDFMVSGHSHNYQRSVPIRGVRYLVSGGGGGSLYDSAVDEPALAFATTCYHYVSAHITNEVLQLRGVRSDGRIFDTTTVTNRRQVRVEPAFPLRGETATVYYRATEGPLAGESPIYVYIGQDGFTNAFVDAAMTWNEGLDRWEYEFTVPSTATNRVAFVFHNAAGDNWHNNYGYDWQALLGRASVSPAVPTAGMIYTAESSDTNIVGVSITAGGDLELDPRNPGQALITIHATDPVTGYTASYSFLVTVVGEPTIVSQDFLEREPWNPRFTQLLQVRNDSGLDAVGVRVLFSDLEEGISVENQTGTSSDGRPMIEMETAFTNGAVLDLNIVYLCVGAYRIDQYPATLELQYILPGWIPPLPGEGTVIENAIPLSGGRYILQFDSLVGHLYAIEYRNNFPGGEWVEVPLRLRATANQTQWIDAGPPATLPPEGLRVYRVKEIVE